MKWIKAKTEFPKSKIWRVVYSEHGRHSINPLSYESHDSQNMYFKDSEPLLLSNVEWLDESIEEQKVAQKEPLSPEEVLDKHYNQNLGFLSITYEQVLAAMIEYHNQFK
jgi:hypothetical protein